MIRLAHLLTQLMDHLYGKLQIGKGPDYAAYTCIKENWKRHLEYLDDCFIYWPYALGNIADFLQILNSMHNLQST